MNKAQRLVLVLYCLLLAYCCLWVPWHIAQGQDYLRAGYGWLWAGPSHSEFDAYLTAPDFPIIALRLVAATAVCGAAYAAIQP